MEDYKTAVLSRLTDKPQDRWTLSKSLGISERAFRDTVRQLRLEGHPIATSSHGKGYKIGTREEVLRTARELRSRAYDQLRTARALEGIDPDQIEMEEVDEKHHAGRQDG